MVPPEVRVDTGVRDGSSVSVFYDSMIAKLIVHAPDRQIAVNKTKTINCFAGCLLLIVDDSWRVWLMH